MKFTPIDLTTWPRGQMFYYFSKMAPTGYSITVTVDVTALKKTLDNNNLKLFPTYLWLITKNLNEQIEFKVAGKRRSNSHATFPNLPPCHHRRIQLEVVFRRIAA